VIDFLELISQGDFPFSVPKIASRDDVRGRKHIPPPATTPSLNILDFALGAVCNRYSWKACQFKAPKLNIVNVLHRGRRSSSWDKA
jgi:hypothetical protein